MDARHEPATNAVWSLGERGWTSVEKHKLKGLAANHVSIRKIARILRRSVSSTAIMAEKLGVPLDVAG